MTTEIRVTINLEIEPQSPSLRLSKSVRGESGSLIASGVLETETITPKVSLEFSWNFR